MQSLAVVILLITVYSGLHCTAISNKKESLKFFLNVFNYTRNTNFSPELKKRARTFIIFFFEYISGLETWTEEFPSNDGPEYPGINVVGVLPGIHYRQTTDKIFIIASHYDSVSTTPGVDDNGSGMAALLQSIKQYTAEDPKACLRRDYTLMFVAFDLEERQSSTMCGNVTCGCPKGSILCGSRHFVRNFTAYLNSSGSRLQGAVVLETLLNYNTTENSQLFPPGAELAFSTIYNQEKERSFRGDFLAVVGRQDDGVLLQSLAKHYPVTTEYRQVPIQLPFQGPPTIAIFNMFRDFFRSDHTSFWFANLSALMLSDTANFRGFMIDCYHQSCDDMNHVTPMMIEFLSKTVDTVTAMARDLTTNKECGGLFNHTKKGVLTSKYYPCTYPNSMDCVWTIDSTQYLQQKYTLALAFEDFQLEESNNCTQDFLEIREGTEESSPLLGKFCGTTIPATLRTEKMAYRLYFHTNKVKTSKGFKISWDIKEQTSKSGVIRAQSVYLAVSLVMFILATLQIDL